MKYDVSQINRFTKTTNTCWLQLCALKLENEISTRKTAERSTLQATCTVLNMIDFVFYLLQESFFCVFLERSFLVLQGQQEGRELRLHSSEKVSLTVRLPKKRTSIGTSFLNSSCCSISKLFLKLCVWSQDKHFAITIADTFIVHYGSKQISADHNQTTYMSYYIGGLPALLRQR